MPPTRAPPLATLKRRTTPWGNKHLQTRGSIVFQSIIRFYSTFATLSALVGALSIGALTFPDFHPSSGLIRIGEGLLCSSAVTAVLAAVMATMLMFTFEGFEGATRADLVVAWSPLVMLDVSILEFLVGVTCWYRGMHDDWRGVLMIAQLCLMLGGCVGYATWMWLRLGRKGGLGEEENRTAEDNV